MSRYLHGFNDIGGESLHGDRPGWTLVNEQVGLNTAHGGSNYDAISNRGIGVVVRMNHAYGQGGTIPLPAFYREYAQACASFARYSSPVDYFIVGNEPNLERPNGVVITPAEYARCFAMTYEAMKKAKSNAKIVPAALAPYNASPIPWVDFMAEMLELIVGTTGCDAVNFHAYTRSMNPQDIYSNATMDDPLQGLYYGFKTCEDALLKGTPTALRHLPAMNTEFDIYDAWQDRNAGVITEHYKYFNARNAVAGNQQVIMSLCFRWLGEPDVTNERDWEMRNKPHLLDDFRAAVDRGFASPAPTSQPAPAPMVTHLPAVSGGTSTNPLSQRLLEWGATLKRAIVQPGQTSWEVIAADGPLIRGGNVNIYVDAVDEHGQRLAGVPIEFYWDNGRQTWVSPTEAKPDEPDQGTNMPMSAGGNAYGVRVADGNPSDDLFGMGMVPWQEHHSYRVKVQRKVAASAPTPAPQPTQPGQPATIDGPSATPITPAGARIRAYPGVTSAILGNVVTGTPMVVTGRNVAATWWRVESSFGVGWVSDTVVQTRDVGGVPVVEGDAPTPAPVTQPTPTPVSTGIIDPITALAFLQVESNNVAFRDNLLTIRFEVHVFKGLLGNDSLFDMHFKFTPGNYSDQYWRTTPSAPWINAHGPMPERHQLLNFARGLNDTAALRSTGMGMAQVMGGNHARIGYATPQAMFNAFKHPRYGVNAQVLGFVDYVLSDPALLAALRGGDWYASVQKYNGTGQESIYVPALEKALAQIRLELGA